MESLKEKELKKSEQKLDYISTISTNKYIYWTTIDEKEREYEYKITTSVEGGRKFSIR